MTGERIIDFSRYRMAEAIAELWAAGESVASIAGAYDFDPYVVELVIAAHDRKDRYAGHVTRSAGGRLA